MAQGKGQTFSSDLLKLIFNATAIANIADNASVSPLTNLFITLQTASAGATGTGATNEIAYTSYARATVARSGAGWTVGTATVSPASSISFATGTGGAGTATDFTITTNVTVGNASKILYFGTVSPSIVCGNGITPQLTTSSAVTEA